MVAMDASAPGDRAARLRVPAGIFMDGARAALVVGRPQRFASSLASTQPRRVALLSKVASAAPETGDVTVNSPTAPSRPLVTVTFVAWQRPDALRRGIESCLMQDYPAIEILVVDNSPTDAIHRWLLTSFPQVKTIKTPKPIALPAARNLLVATAAGDYVFFHDDDSYFMRSSDLSRAMDYLEARPQVACLAFRVGDGERDWNPQFDAPEPCPTYNFIACATLFRRVDFSAAGWYFEDFWLYGEERVMSLGFFGLGKEIHLLPTVSIAHRPSNIGRARDNGARYHLCDVVMSPGLALLRFPVPDVFLWYPILWVAYFFQVAVLRRRPWIALKGMVIGLQFIPKFLRARKPISRAHLQRWFATRAEFNYAYLHRVGRWRWYHRFLPAMG
jgi:GT2 family glycosyltransferase